MAAKAIERAIRNPSAAIVRRVIGSRESDYN